MRSCRSAGHADRMLVEVRSSSQSNPGLRRRMVVMAGLNWKAIAAKSPLTDPRSLGSSLMFHALLLVLASLVALSGGVTEAPDLPRALSGEIDPVDNRAPSRDGGGSPGELGGEGLVEVLPQADG